jgi:hypothetical protein
MYMFVKVTASPPPVTVRVSPVAASRGGSFRQNGPGVTSWVTPEPFSSAVTAQGAKASPAMHIGLPRWKIIPLAYKPLSVKVFIIPSHFPFKINYPHRKKP